METEFTEKQLPCPRLTFWEGPFGTVYMSDDDGRTGTVIHVTGATGVEIGHKSTALPNNSRQILSGEVTISW